MSAMKKREPRRRVLVRARMRIGANWGDVVIHNMSSRGMLVAVDGDFRPGNVIEIRRIHHVVIGRVVWRQGLYMGIRTQDPIDMDGIVSAKPPASKPGTAAASSDRRAAPRVASVAERAEASRQLSRLFQFAALLGVIVTASVIIAGEVRNLLGTPLEQVARHLGNPEVQTSATNNVR